MEMGTNDLLDSFALQLFTIFLSEIINCVDSADCKPYCLMLYNHKYYLRRKSIQINCIKKNWIGDSSNILFIYNNTRNNFSIHNNIL